MRRFVPLVILVALTLCVATSEAGRKKRKAPRGTLVGTIAAVNEGKSITVVALGRKKKVPGPTTEVKLTERTKVTYIGLNSKDEQKLKPGLFVMVALDEQDTTTATAIAAGNQPRMARKNKMKQARPAD